MQFIPNTRLTACVQRSFNFSVAAFRRLGNKLYIYETIRAPARMVFLLLRETGASPLLSPAHSVISEQAASCQSSRVRSISTVGICLPSRS